MVSLGEVAEIVSGATPKTQVAEYWDGDILWATPADLGKLDSPFIGETPRTISVTGLESCAATVLPPGSVLLSSRAPIGHVAINTAPMATNQGFKSLIPKADRLDAKYLYHWLKSRTGYLQSLGNGATFKEISKATVSRIDIPIPSLEKQRRIVAILDHADRLRKQRRQVIASLNELSQAAFHNLFGNPLSNNQHFPMRILNDWINPSRPITYGILKPGPDVTDGIPYVRVADMKNGGIDERSIRRTSPAINAQYKRSLLRTGDLLMSIRGHVGRFAFVPETLSGANITQDSARIAIDEPVSAVYVRAAMETPSLQHWMARRTKGAAVQGINLGDVKQIPIPCPPLWQQEQLAVVLSCINSQLDLAQLELVRLDELFSSLESRAFQLEL